MCPRLRSTSSTIATVDARFDSRSLSNRPTFVSAFTASIIAGERRQIQMTSEKTAWTSWGMLAVAAVTSGVLIWGIVSLGADSGDGGVLAPGPPRALPGTAEPGARPALVDHA